MTAVIGKKYAGTKSDSTKTVNIKPVIILCLNLCITVFLGQTAETSVS